VLKGASLILVLADHDEFRALDPFEVASTVRVKKVLDTRNTLDHARWQNAGFDVYVLGKGKAKE
jgi:UDP-N-acetyl-D-mannosaminuronic acid dehydrogenase